MQCGWHLKTYAAVDTVEKPKSYTDTWFRMRIWDLQENLMVQWHFSDRLWLGNELSREKSIRDLVEEVTLSLKFKMQRERKRNGETNGQKYEGLPHRCKLSVAEISLEILKKWKTASVVELRQRKIDMDEIGEVGEDCNARPLVHIEPLSYGQWNRCQEVLNKFIMDEHLHFPKIIPGTLKMYWREAL